MTAPTPPTRTAPASAPQRPESHDMGGGKYASGVGNYVMTIFKWRWGR